MRKKIRNTSLPAVICAVITLGLLITSLASLYALDKIYKHHIEKIVVLAQANEVLIKKVRSLEDKMAWKLNPQITLHTGSVYAGEGQVVIEEYKKKGKTAD